MLVAWAWLVSRTRADNPAATRTMYMTSSSTTRKLRYYLEEYVDTEEVQERRLVDVPTVGN